jgi:cell division protein FtsW
MGRAKKRKQDMYAKYERPSDFVSDTPNWKPRELSTEYYDKGMKSPGIDIPFLVITLVILAFGLIMLFSASYARQSYSAEGPMNLFTQQLFFAIIGVVIMFITSRFPIRLIGRWSVLLLFGSIALLVLVLFIGVRVNGATRWIGIGGERGFRFQPSELAKLAVILAFAQMSCRFGDKRMGTFKFGVLPFVIPTLLIVVLLYLQPHLSAAIIIAVLAMIMMFAGGTRFRWFLLAGTFAAVVVLALLYMSMVTEPVESDEAVGGHVEQTITWDFSRFGYAGRRIN